MSRKLAREAAFKALFQLDFNFEAAEPEASEKSAIETMFDDNPKLTLKKDLAFIEELVKGTRSHMIEIDELIRSRLKEGWQMSRLLATDRNVLRLAVYEMKFAAPPLPKNIAINEAVELAKRYGNDDSGRFVNGILVALSK